jgi:NAD(P)-dependent dehydrogenase (short-subunit alcohol dehydrogenase family)
MLERGYGRVLTIASVSSLLGHPHHAPYAASKGGVALLTKVLATEWAARGVTANAIGPTYVETNLNAAELAEPGVREAIVGRIPMGRLGKPEDIVGAAVYLCSDAAAFVTGQVLYVDGGRTAD